MRVLSVATRSATSSPFSVSEISKSHSRWGMLAHFLHGDASRLAPVRKPRKATKAAKIHLDCKTILMFESFGNNIKAQ